MKRFMWPCLLTLALTLGGCDQVAQLLGVVGSNYRPPYKTGAVRGRIVDRNGNPLVGAKVSNGAAVFFTANDPSAGPAVKVKDDSFNANGSDADKASHQVTLGAGEFILSKIAGDNVSSITAEYDGQGTAPLQVFVKAQAFLASATSSVTSVTDIKIPVDGPVDSSRQNAVQFVGTSLPGNVITVTAATNSVVASYAPSDTVSLFLQAPPNSKGATVYNSLVTFFPAGTTDFVNTPALDQTTTTGVGPNGNPLTRPLQFPVTVVSGSALRSGQMNQVDVKVSSTNAAFVNYLRTNNGLVAKIDLFASTSIQPATQLTDRGGNPVFAAVSMRFQSQ